LFVAWVVFHVVVCIALIIVVLMQSAKGEGLAGGTAFGGGVSSAVFGGRGAASFLSKATTVLAVVFFVNCGALALMSANTRVGLSLGSEESEPESAVTRRAQSEREEAMERQRLQEEAALQDSLAREGEQMPAFNLDSIAVESSGETEPATEDTASGN
jgi:preprotein translocase subunit SecG